MYYSEVEAVFGRGPDAFYPGEWVLSEGAGSPRAYQWQDRSLWTTVYFTEYGKVYDAEEELAPAARLRKWLGWGTVNPSMDAY
jgi:hypothetical protein